MTTSSAINSVFRGFFEKQKLTGPNFIDWYRQLRIVLSIEDKLNYLEQPLPPAPVAPAGQHVAPEILAAHTAWVKGSKEIAGLMLMTMEPEIQRNLENLHANDMLKELKALFAQQAEQELLQTTRDFHACKQEEGQSVSSYVLRMKGYIDNLERLGHPVTLGLALHEQTLNLPKNNALLYLLIRAGHWKRNCPQLLSRKLLKKKRSKLSGAGGGSGSKCKWNMKPGALRLVRGQWTNVEACGSIGTLIYLFTIGLTAARHSQYGSNPTKKVKKTPYEDGSFMGQALKLFAIKSLENSLISKKQSGVLEDLEIIHEEGYASFCPQGHDIPQICSISSAMGSIMYDVRCTRSDVAFAQNITSRFQQNPSDLHWTTVKNILKYLRNTEDMFLVYGVLRWICVRFESEVLLTKRVPTKAFFATSSSDAELMAAF
ncbi:hypothetical protein Tco_0174020 [Tanacetum coccineum]